MSNAVMTDDWAKTKNKKVIRSAMTQSFSNSGDSKLNPNENQRDYDYEVVVTNFGVVKKAYQKELAEKFFESYKEKSDAKDGSYVGQSVRLLERDKVIKEHIGALEYRKEKYQVFVRNPLTGLCVLICDTNDDSHASIVFEYLEKQTKNKFNIMYDARVYLMWDDKVFKVYDPKAARNK